MTEFKYNLSVNFCEKYFLSLLREWNIDIGNQKFKRGFQINFFSRVNLTYEDIILSIQKNGYLENVEDQLLFLKDPVLKNQFSMATTAEGVEIKIESNGKESKIKGSGRISPIEEDLASDLIYYYKNFLYISKESDNSIENHSRLYRSIIIFSINFIDAFILKHVLYFESKHLFEKECVEIRKERIFPAKVRKFYSLGKEKNTEILCNTKEYHRFFELNRIRNSILHTSNSNIIYTLKEMSENISKIRIGVASFLKTIRMNFDFPTPYYLSQIINLPEIIK
ncbi:hypothetical protein EHQ58_14795 [Leptospira ognonensis]|uniref:Uncharacterized protein n=1 Tax=Leptospira ognonensis TaxID=2484945 RepID=A0A4R9JZL8_9LEPT|nr:hypothetical protein [Leptospira ognonensis]TGL57189.1 hypothetical protein EHQ58_14795 [Leptospira ognonensis]